MSDNAPGIVRTRRGKSFSYRHPDGRGLSDPDLARVRSLAVPPAWSDVWICPNARGHLQATGRDARGRKQHRYHPQWTAIRDETKYSRMLAFAAALPALRRRTARDLAEGRGLSRRKVVAAVVRLLERTLIRVGNDEYARQNGSFGLTTFRNRHATVSKGEIRFRFRGKSGKVHDVALSDARLARIVKNCQDLPGSQLFQYADERGQLRPICSQDVNAYVRSAMGEAFTAKDFRTWAGTVLAARALGELGPPASRTHGERQVVRAADAVAGVLGNTRAVCRRSYIHPEVIEAYLDGSFRQLSRADSGQRTAGLSRDEVVVLALLSRRVKAETKRAA